MSIQGKGTFKELFLESPVDKRHRNAVKKVDAHLIRNEKLYVPLAFGLTKGFEIDKSNYVKTNIKFEGTLRDYQQEVYPSLLSSLRENNTGFWRFRTGFGKSVLAIKAITDLGLRTIIFIHNKTIIGQMANEISQFTDAKVCILEKYRKKEIPEADIYIGTKTEMKYMSDDLKKTIGFLICDEARLQCTELCLHAMMNITPRYAIALSADYKRDDNMSRIIDLMFGKETIFIPDDRDLTIYKMYTGFVPKVIGKKIDWTDIVNQMSSNEDRNKFITKCAVEDLNNGKKIIIECERSNKIPHIDILHDMIVAEVGNKFKISKYFGDMKDGYENCDALIVSIKKGGVGFDSKSSCKDVWDGRHFDTVYIVISGLLIEQKVGRAREKNVLIRHFIDNFSSCEKHWLVNLDWYKSRKGKTTVKEYFQKMLI